MTTPPPIKVVQQARAQTLAAGSARVKVTTEFPPIPSMRPEPALGAVKTVVWGAANFVGDRLWRLAGPTLDWRLQEFTGVIDFAGRRYSLVANAQFASLYVDEKEWTGLPGQAVDTVPLLGSNVPTPLWLIDVLAGVTDVHDAGTDPIRGTTCRRLAVTFDLSQASRDVAGGVGVPSVARFEDLLALTADVWVDDRHVRRVRFVQGDETETVDFWDFGVALADVDWTRLPAWRPPPES